MKNFFVALLFVLLGLCSFEGRAVSWSNFTIDTPPGAVYILHQSADGPVWVGSGQGLYLFDGFRARAVPDPSGSPFAAQIYAIVENTDGSMWLGTNNGLFRYEPAANCVLPVEGAFPKEIRAMIADPAGRLWIGSLQGLFLCLPPEPGGSGTEISDLSSGLPHRAVYTLLLSKSDGCIYAGTYDGLCRFAPGSMQPEQVELGQSRSHEGNCFVNALADDPSTGEIFIGTEGALLVYAPASGAVRHIAAVSGNSIKSLALNGRFLAAGTDNGLYIIDRAGAAECFRHDSRRPSSIADNVVWTLMTDASGNLWAGTGVGLSIAGGDSAVSLISLADITASGEGQTVYSIFRDSRRRLWLGGANGLILAPEGLTPAADPAAVRWHAQSSDRFPLPHNRVRALAETSDGRVLMAGDGGLNVLDEATGRFRRLRLVDSSRTRNANWAYALAEDSASRCLWVGGYLGGIFRLPLEALSSPDGTTITADTALTADNGTLPSNLINNIIRDSSGALWALLYREGAVRRLLPGSEARTVDILEATGGWPTLIAPDPEGNGVWVGFDGGGVVHVDSTATPAA
ncbi:MAG: hypothetical protein K2M06_00265, partial [Muribaculaceae bacterium]|nr:hypothetical protein [Muribaculaceae bacterium]